MTPVPKRIAEDRMRIAEYMAERGFNKDTLLEAIGFPRVVEWVVTPPPLYGRVAFDLSSLRSGNTIYATKTGYDADGQPRPVTGTGEPGLTSGNPMMVGDEIIMTIPPGWLRFEAKLTFIYSDGTTRNAVIGDSEAYFLYAVGGTLVGACGPQLQRIERSNPPWTVDFPASGTGSLEVAAWVGAVSEDADFVAYANQLASPPVIEFDFGSQDVNPALGWCYKGGTSTPDPNAGLYDPARLNERYDHFTYRDNGKFVVPPAPNWRLPYWLDNSR